MSAAAPPAPRVCVFAGSHRGRRERYVRAARELVRALAARGCALVYGGGNVGLMNELAEAALARGMPVVGVIPRRLVEREAAHTGLTELRVVEGMLERKALMAELSDAFVALPGGLGTLDEIFEVLTWLQLGIHAKPCGVLNVDGFFDPLLAAIARGVEEGFIGEQHAGLLRVGEDPARLIEVLI